MLLERTDIIAEVASDLADTSKEKFAKLTEEVEYSNADDFKRNVRLLRNHISEIKEANSDSEVDNAVADNQGVNTEDLSNAMAAYTTAISKLKTLSCQINRREEKDMYLSETYQKNGSQY